MYAILPNLLFYPYQIKFPPAGYLCIDSTTYSFGSPPSTFKILCYKGGIDCYHPVQDFKSSVKLILRRNLLASGTSSGARSAKDIISIINSSDFLWWR